MTQQKKYADKIFPVITCCKEATVLMLAVISKAVHVMAANWSHGILTVICLVKKNNRQTKYLC